jgi:four helix bundle protein
VLGKRRINVVNDFNDLKVWKEAESLVLEIYKATKHFPRQEMFGLTDQLRRAGTSICANIAEGFARFHPKDKVKFYYTARGSASEIKSHLIIAKDLGYISSEVAEDLLSRIDPIRMMLNGMIRSILSKPPNPHT